MVLVWPTRSTRQSSGTDTRPVASEFLFCPVPQAKYTSSMEPSSPLHARDSPNATAAQAAAELLTSPSGHGFAGRTSDGGARAPGVRTDRALYSLPQVCS